MMYSLYKSPLEANELSSHDCFYHHDFYYRYPPPPQRPRLKMRARCPTLGIRTGIQNLYCDTMGIRGLTTFMRDNYEWLCVPIGSIKRLVIDGSNLCYKLYEENDHEWVMGGDYPGFHRTVTAFLGKLQTLGIQSLHIILDGIDYKEEKTTTVRKRQEESYEQIRRHQSRKSAASVLPLLARLVFIDALRSGDLPFYIADGEADAEIVALANFYGCPVLADDSDFYIFNIKGGYIPLQQFFETLEDITEVRVYDTISMAQQFNLQDRDLRLLIPAILGNDFMKQVPYPHLQNPEAIIQTISRCLSVTQFLDHVPDRVDKGSLHENYSKAAVLYNDVKLIQNTAELSELTNLNIPKWMLERYRKGCLAPQVVTALMTHKRILPVVVDDIKSKCAHYVGLRIRQYMYGILNCHQPVQETARDNGTTHLTDKERQCLQFDPPLSLDMICGLDDTEKSQILCSVLRCHKLVDCIAQEWKLVMASCIYWYKKAKPSHHLLKALVKCLVTCHGGHMAASQRDYTVPQKAPKFS